MSKRRTKEVIGGTAIIALAVIGVAVSAQIGRGDPVEYTSNYVPATPEEYDPLDVSILGDSYTNGVGSPYHVGYAKMISNELCWNLNEQGQPGTGYITQGIDGRAPFTDPNRLRTLLGSKPELVIVQGSTNDVQRIGVREAAAETFAAIKASAPTATIVAVGPTIPESVTAADARAVRDAVRDAAKSAGVAFIDPIAQSWLSSRTLYDVDRLHPNYNGHEEYATQLRRQLEALKIPRLNTCDPV